MVIIPWLYECHSIWLQTKLNHATDAINAMVIIMVVPCRCHCHGITMVITIWLYEYHATDAINAMVMTMLIAMVVPC